MPAPLVSLPTLLGIPEPAPRPKLRPVAWPYAEEMAYAAVLLNEARLAAAGVRQTLVPKLDPLFAYAGRRLAPRTDDMGERLQSLMGTLRRAYDVSTNEARQMATRMLKAVSAQQAKEFTTSYGTVIRINPMVGSEKWLPDAMAVATRENVALIQSIPSQLFDQVEKLVSDAVMQGLRPEALAAQLLERFDITERRALLIATDQVGKWHGSLQRFRQLDAGITRFEWSTSRDERVRRSHRLREGRVYAWSDPPDGEIPGSPIRCRCIAAPFLESD